MLWCAMIASNLCSIRALRVWMLKSELETACKFSSACLTRPITASLTSSGSRSSILKTCLTSISIAPMSEFPWLGGGASVTLELAKKKTGPSEGPAFSEKHSGQERHSSSADFIEAAHFGNEKTSQKEKSSTVRCFLYSVGKIAFPHRAENAEVSEAQDAYPLRKIRHHAKGKATQKHSLSCSGNEAASASAKEKTFPSRYPSHSIAQRPARIENTFQ